MAVPNAPTTLVTTAGNAQVSITWTAPSATPALTDYLIQHSINGSDWTTFVDGVSTVASVTVTGLTNNQLYLFRIAGINADGTGAFSGIVTATPVEDRLPEYCQASDIADWLHIDINANTIPNTKMVKSVILMSEDDIDRRTNHTWKASKQVRGQVFDVSAIWDYGRGMYIPLRHRNIKTWDESKGDMFEIWTGTGWQAQSVATNSSLLNIEESQGSMHIRGYIYTILTRKRFRVTYRYGGDREGDDVPRDIKKCAILLTCIDLLTSDFKMSQVTYGGEGNIQKQALIEKWEAKSNKIIADHSEIMTVW